MLIITSPLSGSKFATTIKTGTTTLSIFPVKIDQRNRGLTCASIGISIWYLWRCRRQQKKHRCLMIMSRYPSPGTTKTRLIPSIGDRGAALVQLYMTENILDRVSQGKKNDSDLHVEVIYTGATESMMKYWLGKRKRCTQLSWRPQVRGGLGEKLTAVFNAAFNEGAKYVVTVGSDIPRINYDIINEAFKSLSCGKPMVLGKAADGGYYLVGMSQHVQSQLDNVFKNVDWGTEIVFEQQVEQARRLGIEPGILKTTLSDVDTSEDIAVFEEAMGFSAASLLHPSLSVIIPVYNEVDNIVKTIQDVIKKTKSPERLEIIVTDGGSHDGTQDAVRLFARQSNIPVTLLDGPPGRGPQLIHGTELAKGDNLLFLHADTVVPKDYDEMLQKCLEVPGNVAGAFGFDLDIFHPDLWSDKVPRLFYLKMKLICKATRIRSTVIELPYGDQGLFTRRQTYDKVGGYDRVYLMEDYIMVKKLQKLGHVAIAPGDPVITSARRWLKFGALTITFLNILIVFAYRWGIHPDTLARWYYGEKLKKILNKEK